MYRCHFDEYDLFMETLPLPLSLYTSAKRFTDVNRSEATIDLVALYGMILQLYILNYRYIVVLLIIKS